MYMNEGFVNFSVDNAILNINDSKDRVFIEVSVTEGEQYKFGETNFLGNPTYDKQESSKASLFQPGEQFFSQTRGFTSALKNHIRR